MRKIENTGQLRAFLAKTLQQLQAGKADVDAVRVMVKVATQINESIYSEIKVARVMAEAGKEVHGFGSLAIGDGSETEPEEEQREAA